MVLRPPFITSFTSTDPLFVEGGVQTKNVRFFVEETPVLMEKKFQCVHFFFLSSLRFRSFI